MKAKKWSREIEQELLGRFEYDPIEGCIRKREVVGSLVLQGKTIGSLSPTGDWVFTVALTHAPGKLTMIRLARLAVFLQTGQQCEHLIFKDGNRSNMKWDNLLPIGLLSNEKVSPARLEEARSLYEKRKLEEAAKAVEIAREKTRIRQLARETDEQRERRLIREAKAEADRIAAAGVAEFLKNNPSGYVDTTSWSGPSQEEIELDKAHRDACAMDSSYRIERGLVTGMSYDQVREFWKLHDPSGSGYVEFLEECKRLGQDWLAVQPKPIHDKVTAAYLLTYFDEGSFVLRSVNEFMSEYKWQGQPVKGSYNDLSPQAQLWLTQQQTMIRDRALRAKNLVEQSLLDKPRHE